MEEKRCAIEECKILLTKNKGESKDVFKRRKTCGLTHARQYMRENRVGWYSNTFKLNEKKEEVSSQT